MSFWLGHQYGSLFKAGAEAPQSAWLSGKLYASASGWILLSVPNAIGNGAFKALNAPGVSQPISGETGLYNAHISVIRPEELKSIGLTPDDITERGKEFDFSLGGVKTVEPQGWAGVSRVWFLVAHSPQLERLRRTYGLTSLPNNNNYEFHMTFAVRTKNVLYENPTSKSSSAVARLRAAKYESDRGNYGRKHEDARQMMIETPADFKLELPVNASVVGVRHVPSGFKMHLPARVVPDWMMTAALISAKGNDNADTPPVPTPLA